MLDVISLSLFGWLWELFGKPNQEWKTLELTPWHEARLFEIPSEEFDPMVQDIVDRYLKDLSQQGINSDRQGLWLQSDWVELGNHQGTKTVSAASLTKIATTLAVLGKLGIDREFVTKIYHTGSIEEGVLKGDLIVRGDRDPLFVWEEAIALSNSLNQLGIREITGDLLVSDQFYMNYKSDPVMSRKLLRQGLEPARWTNEAKRQFQKLPLTTPQPKLKIQGKTKVARYIPPKAQMLLQHHSLPLVTILQQMNIYSNNEIAQMLADRIGGASVVAKYAIETTGVSAEEIQLINGSGLGVENQISPRAATKMLMAIDDLLQPHGLEITQIFPVGGRDTVGTMENRQIPSGVSVKTGTLNQVSALAGVIPLSDRRRVWFAIVNSGWQIKQFRQHQDKLLQSLAARWQLAEETKDTSWSKTKIYLGDPERNKVSN